MTVKPVDMPASFFPIGHRTAGALIHAVNDGDGNGFRVETNYEYNPMDSGSLVGHPTIAVINRQVDVVSAIVQGTPIKLDLEWNCQHWVSDALQRLVEVNYITAEEKDQGIDLMVDVLLQGSDDDL